MWRARVPLTALVVLACGAVVVGALRPTPDDVVPVVVTTRALEAGAVLDRGDVRTASWPARLAPEGAADDDAAVEGRSLAVALPAGAPLAGGVLVDDARWAQAPPGTVAAPVRLTDPELAAMLAVGDRLDVLTVPHEGGGARRVARGALLLTGPATDEDGGGLFGAGPAAASGLVLLAVTPAEARELAEHAATGSVTAVVVR